MPSGDDPFRPSNATVLRPKPGAGKRPAAAPPPAPPPPSAPPPTFRRGSAPQPGPGPAALRRLPGQGLNPLVSAAVPLLLMAGGMRGSTIQGDVPALRRQALEEIRGFEESARAAGIANEVIIAGRYALCAALDEAVLATPWGAHSDWAQQTLLNTLHREAYGGEKFFEMLERIAQEPGLRIDLIELQYLCIALGARAGAVAALAGCAGPAQPTGALPALVGCGRGGPHADDRDVPVPQVPPGQPGGSDLRGARADRHAERGGGSTRHSRGPRRPDAAPAARGRGGERPVAHR